MDSEYLKRHVGSALSLGLSEVCMKRPQDPIEYLALWLRKYVENTEYDNKKAADAAQLLIERDEAALEERKQQAMREEQELIAQQEEARRKAEEEALAAARMAAEAEAKAAEASLNESTKEGASEEKVQQEDLGNNNVRVEIDTVAGDTTSAADDVAVDESQDISVADSLDEAKEDTGGGADE